MKKKSFELTPELFKSLLESDKDTFIEGFNEKYYFSALALRCILPLLPTNEARKEFFLSGKLMEKKGEEVLEIINAFFPAFEFLYEARKYELIIELGHIAGAEFLYEKGEKEFLIECSSKSKFLYPIAQALYNKKEWLLLEGSLWKEVIHNSFFVTSGVLAVQEKNGKDIKEAINAAFRGYDEYAGGIYKPDIIYRILKEKAPRLRRLCVAWYDWGKLPDPDVLEVWWYKNVQDDQFKARILNIFEKNPKVLTALQDPSFPATLIEIEKALQ